MSITVNWMAQTHFYSHRPVVLCPEENRTYALNIHGRIVYLTQNEHRLVNWSFDAFFCFFVVTFTMLAIQKELQFRGRIPQTGKTDTAGGHTADV